MRYYTVIFLSFPLLLTLLTCSPSKDLYQKYYSDSKTASHLAKWKARQMESVFDVNVNFSYKDVLVDSKIRFKHLPVPDITKDIKISHYDHGTGISVADVDNDGLEDIYFVNNFGKNELWRNLGGGKFEDITEASGVGLSDRVSLSASFADIDNDGDQDLYVTTVRDGNVLFENIGNGRFKNISIESGIAYKGHTSSAVFFDFDNDGKLDLLLVNIGKFTTGARGANNYCIGNPDAVSLYLDDNFFERSLIFKNIGNNKFENQSDKLKFKNKYWSSDAIVGDFNSDGYVDFMLLSMNGPDTVYINYRGKMFSEQTSQYLPVTSYGSMGGGLIDADGDGDLDIYTVDMHSDMIMDGEWSLDEKYREEDKVYFSPEWYDKTMTNRSVIFGNSLFLNHSTWKEKTKTLYSEVSASFGVENYWPWGVSIADLNADGFQDVFVTAGMGFYNRYSVNKVLLNLRGKRFLSAEFRLGVEPRKNGYTHKEWSTLDCKYWDQANDICNGCRDIPAICKNIDKTVLERTIVKGSLSSRSSVAFDLDSDGDLDLVVGENNAYPQILVSDLAQKNNINFLKIKLEGSSSNRNGIGSTVDLHLNDGRVLRQYYTGKAGYISQSQLPLYFGLGESNRVKRIEIVWPSGIRQTLSDVKASDKVLRVTEPIVKARSVN